MDATHVLVGIVIVFVAIFFSDEFRNMVVESPGIATGATAIITAALTGILNYFQNRSNMKHSEALQKHRSEQDLRMVAVDRFYQVIDQKYDVIYAGFEEIGRDFQAIRMNIYRMESEYSKYRSADYLRDLGSQESSEGGDDMYVFGPMMGSLKDDRIMAAWDEMVGCYDYLNRLDFDLALRIREIAEMEIEERPEDLSEVYDEKEFNKRVREFGYKGADYLSLIDAHRLRREPPQIRGEEEDEPSGNEEDAVT